MMPLIEILVFAVCAFALCAAWWAFGRYLRKHGRVNQLNKMEKGYNAATGRAEKVIGPLARIMLSFGSALSKTPILGSKNQRSAFEHMMKITKKAEDDKTPPKP